MANGPRAASPESLVVCPECQAAVPPRSLELHLRQRHRIYQFAGRRGSRKAIVGRLVEALVCPAPDANAGAVLADLALDEEGDQAPAFLAEVLLHALEQQEESQEEVITALGPVLANLREAAAWTRALAETREQIGRLLALSVTSHLPEFPRDILQMLRALLMDRGLSTDLQLRAVANVVRRLGDHTPVVAELVEKLTSGLNRTRALDRLKQLDQLVGRCPVVEERVGLLEENVRMTCPRCNIDLRRPQMIEHLWQEHRLVLDGRKVREPWAALERWVESCQQQFDPELLRRCRALAEQLPEGNGPAKLHRLLIARGLADAQTRQTLLSEARQEHASRCPWCYALVPIPRELPPLVVQQRHGVLSAGGYRVHLSELGFRPTLRVETPAGVLYDGLEPNQNWTVNGAELLLSGPVVLAALVCAAVATKPLLLVCILLMVACLIDLAVQRAWREFPSAEQRVRGHAWRVLASRLHEGDEGEVKFVIEDSAFLAGLSLFSLREGPRPRPELLRDLIQRTEPAVRSGQGPAGHLATLWRLLIEQAVASGEDPLPLVVAQIGRCFEGGLPLAFAQHLLAGWSSDWLTAGMRARLRILLCERAFEAGFEVRNLLDAGQSAPALGQMLRYSEPRALAGLRLLWSLRPTRPWDRLGEVRTVFELATRHSSLDLLGRQPDILLWQEYPEWVETADVFASRSSRAQVALSPGGVWLQEVCFTDPPRQVEVTTRSGGSQLRLGDRVFQSPSNLEELARVLERWFRYAFHEFLLRQAEVETWQSPDRAAILRVWGAVPCPECSRFLLPRLGEVGLALDETEG
jgi:hypothetical protein